MQATRGSDAIYVTTKAMLDIDRFVWQRWRLLKEKINRMVQIAHGSISTIYGDTKISTGRQKI